MLRMILLKRSNGFMLLNMDDTDSDFDCNHVLRGLMSHFGLLCTHPGKEARGCHRLDT